MPWDDPRDQYRKGGFWRIDDRTGFRVRAWDTKKEWTGALVSESQWEPRHPQDYVRGKPDYRGKANPSPEPIDDFLTVNEVTADDL